jgi:fluoride exporter
VPVFLTVALAGAAGAAARYGLDRLFSRDAHHVPWVTFVITVGGSFVLGAVVSTLDAHPHPAARPAITIGFLGAFTLGSLAAGLAALSAGVFLARSF